MIKIYALILLTVLLFSSQVSLAQVPLPPTNLQIDPMTVLATWDAPESNLLDENFEADILPANWQHTSQGQGWDLASDGMLGLIPIPVHTQYMLTNDGSAGTTNNGCCDYLVSPVLDLTAYPGYHLSFQSFFPGNYMQKAYVEMSTDNGVTWSNLDTLSPYPIWKEINIDLSSYSGPGGLSSVRFAFHADDQGLQASGWAVDDVNVKSDSIGVTGYSVYLDGSMVGVTTNTFWQYFPSMMLYAHYYTCCIQANYPNMTNNFACQSFTDLYKQPPQNLSGIAIGDSILFTWTAPDTISLSLPLVHYNLYINDVFIDTLAVSDTSYKLYCAVGQGCIALTAVYDLTPVGLPGWTESYKVSACGYVDSGFDFPFEEDWISGQFGLNKWTAGPGWAIDGQAGNDAHSVKFTPPPGRAIYQDTLASWYVDATGITECSSADVFLDYHIRLQDLNASGTEKLSVQVSDGSQTFTVAEYTNDGSFDWQMEHKLIVSLIRGTNFRVLFVCSGSGNGVTWNIDNIHVYVPIYKYPNYFDISVQRQGNTENDMLISWEPHQINTMKYILDDGSSEDQLGKDQPGEIWLGNEFPVTETLVLQQASVYIAGIPGSSATYTIDIFDQNKNYTGSSDPFVPVNNDWTDVYLPDIPFSQTFYAMLHIQTTGFSDELGIDTNGPNVPAGYSWVFDGSSWNRISEAGMQPGIFMVRAKALVGYDKGISLNPSAKVSDLKNQSSSLPKGKNANKDSYKPSKSASVQLPCDTLGYSIYRRGYSAYPPGSNNDSGDWEWIGTTPANICQFLDRDLSNNFTNCYEYGISMIFATGETTIAASAWDCIYVGLSELKTGNLKVFPNPADKWVRLELDKKYSHGKIFSITGMEMEHFELTGRPVMILDTSHYSPGTYIVRFTGDDGSSVCQKIMVQH